MYVLSFTEQARQELENMTPAFRKLLVSFLKNQAEDKNTPFTSGHRISNNKHEWFYDFGCRRVMAYIDGSEVVILGFLLNKRYSTEELIANEKDWRCIGRRYIQEVHEGYNQRKNIQNKSKEQ